MAFNEIEGLTISPTICHSLLPPEDYSWAQEAQAYNLLAQEFPHLEQAALEYEDGVREAQAAFDF